MFSSSLEKQERTLKKRRRILNRKCAALVDSLDNSLFNVTIGFDEIRYEFCELYEVSSDDLKYYDSCASKAKLANLERRRTEAANQALNVCALVYSYYDNTSKHPDIE